MQNRTSARASERRCGFAPAEQGEHAGHGELHVPEVAQERAKVAQPEVLPLRHATAPVRHRPREPVQRCAAQVLREDEPSARLERRAYLLECLTLQFPPAVRDSAEHRLEHDEVEVILVRQVCDIQVAVLDSVVDPVPLVQRPGERLGVVEVGADDAVTLQREPEGWSAGTGANLEHVKRPRHGLDKAIPEAHGGRPGADIPPDHVGHQVVVDRHAHASQGFKPP